MPASPRRPVAHHGARWSAAVVALVVATSSASGSDQAADVPATAAATTPVAACPARSAPTPASGRRHLTFGGTDRQYDLSLPEGALDAPAPVILNLHGLTSTIEEQIAVSNLPRAAGARGYVVVTPEAIPATIPIGGPEGIVANFWNMTQLFTQSSAPVTAPTGATATIANANDDLGFLVALLDQVARDLCIDADRQYVTGVSNGAGMTMALACNNDQRFAAVAPVAGVNMGNASAATHATSTIAFHGDADPLVPYAGGDMFGYHLGLPGVVQRLQDVATMGGCQPAPTEVKPAEDARHLTWSCPGGLGVELHTVIGGGHTWPGATTYLDPSTIRRSPDGAAGASPYAAAGVVGHQTTNVIATTLMLDFFDNHRRVHR